MAGSKRFPRDGEQIAELMANFATGDADIRPTTEDGRDLAAVILGRLGGARRRA